MVLKVNELFVTIQGEGPGSGRRACFVRFSGCNLMCSWCDSKYALQSWVPVSVEDLVASIKTTSCRYVVLTGGEPMMQEDIGRLLASMPVWLSVGTICSA